MCIRDRGCEILQSSDLVHWEHVTYVYETLDHTDAQQLKSGQNIYCLLYTSMENTSLQAV